MCLSILGNFAYNCISWVGGTTSTEKTWGKATHEGLSELQNNETKDYELLKEYVIESRTVPLEALGDQENYPQNHTPVKYPCGQILSAMDKGLRNQVGTRDRIWWNSCNWNTVVLCNDQRFQESPTEQRAKNDSWGRHLYIVSTRCVLPAGTLVAPARRARDEWKSNLPHIAHSSCGSRKVHGVGEAVPRLQPRLWIWSWTVEKIRGWSRKNKGLELASLYLSTVRLTPQP